MKGTSASTILLWAAAVTVVLGALTGGLLVIGSRLPATDAGVAVAGALLVALALARYPSMRTQSALGVAFILSLVVLDGSVVAHAQGLAPSFGSFVVFAGCLVFVAGAVVGGIEQDSADAGGL